MDAPLVFVVFVVLVGLTCFSGTTDNQETVSRLVEVDSGAIDSFEARRLAGFDGDRSRIELSAVDMTMRDCHPYLWTAAAAAAAAVYI